MAAWEANVRKVTPYIPGEQPQLTNMIKLNTNENPYPPSPKVQELLKKMDASLLRLYPDPAASALTESLSSYYGLKKEQIFVGVGSDDVLAMSFLTFFNSKKPILFPDITYSFYDVWANLYQIPYKRPALNEDFQMTKEDYYEENGGIIFPNPNAPTGTYQSLEFIEDILQHNQDSVVIVDEAYIDFGGVSALKLINTYENLLIVQTFSKSRSMAGIRIGYGMGNEKLIRCLNDVKYSFNSYTMNMPSLLLGKASLEDEQYFEETVSKIRRTRERVSEELKRLGFHFPASSANFLFVTHPFFRAEELFSALREEDIYVRYFPVGRIKNYLRITIGTDDEMDRLLHFLRNYIQNAEM